MDSRRREEMLLESRSYSCGYELREVISRRSHLGTRTTCEIRVENDEEKAVNLEERTIIKAKMSDELRSLCRVILTRSAGYFELRQFWRRFVFPSRSRRSVVQRYCSGDGMGALSQGRCVGSHEMVALSPEPCVGGEGMVALSPGCYIGGCGLLVAQL